MFTEQPAPPQSIAQVSPPPVDVVVQPTPASTPTQRGIAPPEALPPQSLPSSVAPDPVATPMAAPAPLPTPSISPQPPAPSAEPAPPVPQSESPRGSSTPTETARTKRQLEVEQALLELTNKARAQKRQQAQQQAEMDAAKYAESGDIQAAQQAANNPALPIPIRAKLLRGIVAKQAQKAGKALAQASKSGASGSSPPLSHNLSGLESSRTAGSGYASGYSLSAVPNYATQALLPTGSIDGQFPFAKLLGRVSMGMVFPLTIAVPITSGFGWRVHPISGAPRFHQGLDLGAPFGSPVLAAKAGIVEAADFLGGYGLTIVLRHQNTYQTLYAHLSQVFVKAGDVIKPGQLIGQVGSTGNSTGPHLHFEFHHLTAQGWMALDPAAVLNQAIAQAQQQTQPALASLGKAQQLVNLSASGWLDLNVPDPDLAALPTGNGFLAGLLFPSTEGPTNFPSDNPAMSQLLTNPTANNQAEMLVPFSMLPAAVPELDWLISPFMDSLIASQIPLIPLPGLPAAPQTVSFQPSSVLAQLPAPVAFNPVLPSALNLSQATTEPTANIQLAPVKLATARWAAEQLATQPRVSGPLVPGQASNQSLDRLSIASTVPGAVNLAMLKPAAARKVATNSQPAATTIQPGVNLKTIKLTDRRLKTLKLSEHPVGDRSQTGLKPKT